MTNPIMLRAFRSAAAIPASIVFTDDDAINADTVFNFVGKDIGVVANRSLVLVGVASGDGGSHTHTAVSVGGIAATKIIEHPGEISLSLWRAAVPTGTTADIVVTSSQGTDRLGIGVYAAYDLSSVVETDSASATGDPSSTTDCNVEAGGIAFGISGRAVSEPTAWSGLTEDFDTQQGVVTHSGASAAFASEQIGPTFLANFAGSSGTPKMAVAAFR